ncbi:uncharacterized protein LOC118506789 isoform X1 [Anopheles stephensi]|uniref:uncharacterized protein LOC118506789 isoform X1 n=1 Tax=Anopheles stephensi TaxID=30069 RepID=UPI00165881BA|nr:uncharacterized protein LOC118506789 isoform X1 [Anopheles stephensi]
MQPELLIPTQNEKDYCHFCFGATNLLLVFPHVRPDLQSFIDNVIGIELTTEAQETFSLCEECIGTMDMFITFRGKCRAHYDKVRGMKIMNQAVKKMFPLLQLQQQQQHVSTNAASLSNTTAVNGCNARNINIQLLHPEVCLVEPTMNGSVEADNGSAGSASKRVYPQLSPDIGADSSTKKTRTENDSARKTKYHHIRDLMKRFRDNRLQNNDVSHSPSHTPVNSIPRTIEIINNRPLTTTRHSLPCSIASANYTPQCKPCVVVVKKCLAQPTVADSCKS